MMLSYFIYNSVISAVLYIHYLSLLSMSSYVWDKYSIFDFLIKCYHCMCNEKNCFHEGYSNSMYITLICDQTQSLTTYTPR